MNVNKALLAMALAAAQQAANHPLAQTEPVRQKITFTQQRKEKAYQQRMKKKGR